MEALISLADGREGFEGFGAVDCDGVSTAVVGSDGFEELLLSFGGVLPVVLRDFVVVFEGVEDLEVRVGFEVVVDSAARWRMGELLMFSGTGGGESKWANVELD